MTITEAVKKVIEIRGLEIFKNLKQFLAFLDDLSLVYAEISTFALSFCTKNEGKMKKSWCFRKKTMRLKCLIYRHAS